MAYTPILATLGYVLSPDGKQVLLIHCNTRLDDMHYGKYNGLGGKLEQDEDIIGGMRRELREEANIEADALTLRGTINWPGFGKNGEGWFGFIFLITKWHGTLFSGNDEGTLEWVPVEKLLSLELNLWDSDRYFLPMVFDLTAPVFHSVMPYSNGEMVSWSYSVEG